MQEWSDDETWKLYNQLLDWGCDIPSARDRFLEDDMLYLRCLGRFRDTPAFQSLKESLESGDYAAAYDIAHLMKGTSATLEITPFYERICTLVSYLEKGKRPPKEEIEDLYQIYERYQELVPHMEIEDE